LSINIQNSPRVSQNTLVQDIPFVDLFEETGNLEKYSSVFCVGWTEIITIKTLIGQVYCSFFLSRPLKVINSNQRLFTYMHRKDSLHSTCSMMWNQNCNLFMRLLLKLCEGWHFHYMCKKLLDLNIFFLILFVRFYLKKKTRKITVCTSHSIDRPNRKINWKQC
jgi:hypothetical protein